MALNKLAKKYVKMGFLPMPLRYKDKRPILKGWNFKINPKTCLTYDYTKRNIGFLTGKIGRIIVLDCDLKNGGMEFYNKYISIYGDFDTIQVLSGGGGVHVYFIYNENVAHLTNKSEYNGIGIDIRTNGGYIVAPPSIHDKTGKKYKWKPGFSPDKKKLGEMPLPLLEWLNQDINGIKSSFTIKTISDFPYLEYHPIAKPMRILVSIETIIDLLYCLSKERCNNYTEWIKIGMMLKNIGIENGNEGEMFEIWDEWSQSSNKYQEDSTKMFWEYFSDNYKGQKLTIASLHYWAKKDNSKEYFKIIKYKDPFDIKIELTYEVLKYDFVDHMGGSIFLRRYFKKHIVVASNGDTYIWNEMIKLWIKRTDKDMIAYVSFAICGIYRYCRRYIKEICEESDRAKYQIKQLNKYIGKSKSASWCFKLWQYTKPFFVRDNIIRRFNDIQPYLLPILNLSVIDLRDGSIRKRKYNDYFTFECNVYPGDANNEKVIKFFSDLMDTGKNTEFLQRLMGFCLTGEIPNRQLFVLLGNASNGKSEFINLLSLVTGPYYHRCSSSVFIKNKYANAGGPSPHIANLKGKRVAAFSEASKFDSFNESLLKALTGNDDITARHLHSNEITFKCKAKLLLSLNQLIKFTIDDEAICERLKIIPFPNKFVSNPDLNNPYEKTRDEEFVEEIKTKHLNDVFAYMVQGAIQYYKNKNVEIPKKLEKEKEKMMREKDDMLKFIDEELKYEPGKRVEVKDVHNRYNEWSRQWEKDQIYGRKKFTDMLRKKKLNIVRATNGNVVDGYELQEKSK